eukprot:5884285-Amphidinium_carterae.1
MTSEISDGAAELHGWSSAKLSKFIPPRKRLTCMVDRAAGLSHVCRFKQSCRLDGGVDVRTVASNGARYALVDSCTTHVFLDAQSMVQIWTPEVRNQAHQCSIRLARGSCPAFAWKHKVYSTWSKV